MRKIFNNLEEMNPYYIVKTNTKTNTYQFVENGLPIDILINFDLHTTDRIHANDINAKNITAWDIKAKNITALDIKAHDMHAWNINANNIRAWNINANDIHARNINTHDIYAWDINAKNIHSWNIKAHDILYYAICCAKNKFVCNSIKGTEIYSKHFCLDSEMVINCVD